MVNPVSHLYEFEPFRVDPAKRLLLRKGKPVPLTPKAFDTLLVLVEKRGQVVEKDVLMKLVWPDTVVEENNLAHNVFVLRKALGETADEHRYIITMPGRGYSFVADVSATSDIGADLLVAKRTRSRIVVEEEIG
jgi:eukaryotic-like serine/threonine-protein kinase